MIEPNDPRVKCGILSQLVQHLKGAVIRFHPLLVDFQKVGTRGNGSEGKLGTRFADKWLVHLPAEGVVVLAEEALLRLVVIAEIVEHFLPAFKVIVELSVIHPGNLAEKHVLDKVNGAQGNTAVVKGREQGVGVSMAIDGNLDHDR